MLPGALVDGSKETDDVIMLSDIVKKMGEGADERNHDKAKPQAKYLIHEFIIAHRYDIITGGSVAEWLKAHDSKSCGLARVSEVRILSLPPGSL